jgi:large subunit ribosomal protein L27e
MAKFYKPGRIVIVTNGRFAGKKGIIIRSNFEQTKTKKYPHCLVLGLARAPRRVTKKFLKRLEEKTKSLTDKIANKKADAEALEKLKRFGVFLKSYNMNHLLATRYKASDNYGIESHMTKIENIETEFKETQTKLNKKETEDAKDKEGIENLKKKLGELKEKSKKVFTEFKVHSGTELYNRFMKGFIKTRDNAEENERIANNEFLFSKLKF